MSDKSLLSLREIARELNLNYRTMIDIKNQFLSFLPAQSDGKNNKFSPECVDFFQLIFALRDEGYTCEMIRMMFLKRNPLPEDGEIREWVSGYVEKIEKRWMGMDEDGWRRMPMDENGCGRMGTDGDERGRTRMNEAGCKRMPMDGDGSGRTETDEDGSGGMEMDEDGPTSSGTEGEAPESDHTSEASPPSSPTGPVPFQVPPDVFETFQDQLDHSLSRLESRLLTEFSEIIPQLNSALTQFYKVTAELQARIEKLEADLGVEAPAMTTELDLEAIQVRMEPAYSHADLEFVKNSVHEGKPDKNAVRQWVLSERRKGPEQSYAVLAERLNEVGVPTLSGREGWNRGTLRNIVAER